MIRKVHKTKFRLLPNIHQQRRRAIQAAKQYLYYLKQNDMTSSQLDNYCHTLSLYRLKTLVQSWKFMEEKGRLDELNWYGLDKQVKQDVRYFVYMTPEYEDEKLKHQDTRYRIEEYQEKTIKTANELLSLLCRITDPEAARQYAAQLPSLLKEIQKNNNIINLYLYDDFEGGKQLLPDLSKEFDAINGRLVDEIERIRQSDYYHDASLRKLIVALGLPVLRYLEHPVERADKVVFPE